MLDTINGIKKAYVWVLFLEFSSAFSTVTAQQLLGHLGLLTSVCSWVLDFLTGRPQNACVGSNTSKIITLSHNRVCSAHFAILTHECAQTYSIKHNVKFTYDTTVVGQLMMKPTTETR